MNKNKVRTVMREFKSRDFKSSSGSKVTNPKQAIALSEARKSKSMKKVKKYAEGGLSGISSGAQQMMEEVNQMANRINYGDEAVTGLSQPVGAMAINSMKKGGSVSSASKRADGIAQRGKTRGRIV